MEEKTALVLDDRDAHLQENKKELEKKGYTVTTATTLKEAKERVGKAEKAGQGFNLILSDFDLGTKWYQQHHWFDGYRFVIWCKKQGIKSKIILHSTAFEPSRKIISFLHRPVMRRARKKGVQVQGKSVIMPSHRNRY